MLNAKKSCQHKLRKLNIMNFTNFHKSLNPAGHGELFAMCWTRLLSDCVLWQAPSFLHHQFLSHKQIHNQNWTKNALNIIHADFIFNTNLEELSQNKILATSVFLV